MQIEDKIYLDIEIPDIGRSKFLRSTDVFTFNMVESAGASLPWIEMSIKANSIDIVNCFKQNNKINVIFGTTEIDADTFPLVIEMSNINNDPSGVGWRVEFAGFLYEKSYRVNQTSQSYDGTSIDVVREVYTKEMDKPLDSNFYQVFENPVTWYRTNQSACAFLVDVLLHMRLYPSFPLFAVNKYGTLILRDFKALCAEGPKYTFSSLKASDYNIFNNFNVKNDRDVYNAFSGYKKRIEVTNSSTGKVSFPITENKPVLASTRVSEGLDSGSTVSSNEIQSANVHDWYKETFIYNTNNQVALSSIRGEALLLGRYYRELNPLDLIRLETGVGKKALDGLYLIESIETSVNFSLGVIFTKVMLTRDNMNYVENYVKKSKGLRIQNQFMQKLCAAIYDLRRAYAVGKQFIDGTFMSRMLAFALDTKRNLLRMFSISGVSLDFKSNADLLKSFLLLGNSLMNTLLSMLFPAGIAYAFRDYLIWKPNLRTLLFRYIDQYVPYELQTTITLIVESLDSTTSTLNSIAKDNGITITKEDIKETKFEGFPELPDAPPVEEDIPIVSISTGEIEREEEDMNPNIEDEEDNSQQRVIEIIEEFADRTSGVDIPFPIITLDEAHALLPDAALKDYVATQTILNLTNLGYLVNINEDEFRDVLIGDRESEQEGTIPFTMINQIKANVGTSYNYRFWGTYYDLINLTSFSIKNSYKDKYRTLPCTKLINATKDAKIFFACPKAESDIRFYINSSPAKMNEVIDKFEISLGYKDSTGNDIPYVVYYTKKGYNSSSVLFEVKQGGMV